MEEVEDYVSDVEAGSESDDGSPLAPSTPAGVAPNAFGGAASSGALTSKALPSKTPEAPDSQGFGHQRSGPGAPVRDQAGRRSDPSQQQDVVSHKPAVKTTPPPANTPAVSAVNGPAGAATLRAEQQAHHTRAGSTASASPLLPAASIAAPPAAPSQAQPNLNPAVQVTHHTRGRSTVPASPLMTASSIASPPASHLRNPSYLSPALQVTHHTRVGSVASSAPLIECLSPAASAIPAPEHRSSYRNPSAAPCCGKSASGQSPPTKTAPAAAAFLSPTTSAIDSFPSAGASLEKEKKGYAQQMLEQAATISSTLRMTAAGHGGATVKAVRSTAGTCKSPTWCELEYAPSSRRACGRDMRLSLVQRSCARACYDYVSARLQKISP
jgi:hypothetical protein